MRVCLLRAYHRWRDLVHVANELVEISPDLLRFAYLNAVGVAHRQEAS